MKRKIDNEAEIADHIASRFASVAVIERVDFARISWHEQLEVDAKSDVLMGVHGAGLTQYVAAAGLWCDDPRLLFLPPHAAVVELFTPEGEGNHHYHNLANWANKLYFRSIGGVLRWLTLRRRALGGVAR